MSPFLLFPVHSGDPTCLMGHFTSLHLGIVQVFTKKPHHATLTLFHPWHRNVPALIIDYVCFKTLRAGSRDRVHTCVLGMVMVRCHTGADNGEEDSKYLQPGLGPCGHANTADTGCAAASKTYTLALSYHRDTAAL